MNRSMMNVLMGVMASAMITAPANVLKLVGHQQPTSTAAVALSLVVNFALSDGELGAISTPAAGDLVVVMAASTSNSVTRALAVTGYTQLYQIGVNDGANPFLSVYVGKKVMGATPDTSLTITHPTAGTSGSCTYQIFVFRNHNNVENSNYTATNNVNDLNPPALVIPGSDRISLSLFACGSLNLAVDASIAQFPATLANFASCWTGAGVQSDHGTAAGINHVNAGSFTPTQFVTSSSVADTGFVAVAFHVVIAPTP